MSGLARVRPDRGAAPNYHGFSSKLAITSLLDAPCGDAGWINQANLGVRTIGVDIVPALIEPL